MATPLLPGDSLRGTRVGISVSESPDLARLGLLEEHFRLALGEITRAVLELGGDLVYGGRLGPAGYTAFMVTELQRQSRRNRPLLACLAWQEHRGLALPDLYDFIEDLGPLGRVVCLDLAGAEVDPAGGRGEAPEPVTDPAVRREGLTALRRYMRDRQRGRVFIGGRRSGFEGAVPGVLEEALFALESGQPIYLAGGFGGATLDIARGLGVDDAAWLPQSPEPAVPGYGKIQAIAAAPGWPGLANGLTGEENRWLAASHRPGDIATLVTLGLGRLAGGVAST